MARRNLLPWMLALVAALPPALSACKATGRRAAAASAAGGAARSESDVATADTAAPTESPAALADALKETSAAGAETEPGPYAKDPRFAALAAGWAARVAAAEDRLDTMTGLDVRERGEPRVILAALRDERVPFRIATDVAGGLRRAVLRVNAEPIVSGSGDADRTLLRALSTAALVPPARREAVPPWFSALAGIVAAGDLAERVERLAEAGVAEDSVVRVDPADPSAADPTAAAALLLLAEHVDATAMRRLLVLAADGDNPTTLIARLIKDSEGQWAGAARRALEDAMARIDLEPARALARARTARRDLGREGLEQALEGVAAGSTARTRFDAEADALRLSASVDLGDGFSAREVLERTVPTPEFLGRLSDPGTYLLFAAKAEMLPGGDPETARGHLRRYAADFPAHPGRESALDDLTRLAATAPPAERGEILGDLLAARGIDRLDTKTAAGWIEHLLSEHRPGAARRFLAALGHRGQDPDLGDVASRVSAAEEEPVEASFDANRSRADAWITDPTPETAREVEDGGMVAAGALALSPRFPAVGDGRRQSAVRLLVRAAGFAGAVNLLAVRWGPQSEGLAVDLDVLAGETDYLTLRRTMERTVPGLDSDARAVAAWEAATFGLDPQWLSSHGHVLKHLRSGDFSTRRAAFDEVEGAGLLTEAPALLARMAKDAATALRRQAVIVAGRMGIGVIAREALADDSWIVRQAACTAVADAREKAAVPQLLAMISTPDPDSRVRLAATHALLEMAPSDRRVTRSLVALLRGKDEALAEDVSRRLPSLVNEANGGGVAEEVAAALRAEVSQPEAQVDRGAVFRLFLAYRRTTKRDPGYDPSLPIERVREMAAALPESRPASGGVPR